MLLKETRDRLKNIWKSSIFKNRHWYIYSVLIQTFYILGRLPNSGCQKEIFRQEVLDLFNKTKIGNTEEEKYDDGPENLEKKVVLKEKKTKITVSFSIYLEEISFITILRISIKTLEIRINLFVYIWLASLMKNVCLISKC